MSVENYRSKSKDNLKQEEQQYPESKGEHKLDSEEMREKHKRLYEWLCQSRENQAENRNDQAIDEDFYDGLQWDEHDAQELLERGQAPLVFNHIKSAIDWIIGTERRTRVDFKVYPRSDQEEARIVAQSKTKLLKYLHDANKSQYAFSRAFADAVKVGVGWIEIGIRNNEVEEPLFIRYENWKNMWYDGLAVERDLSDARFLFRSKWVDLDVALAMFPKRQEAVRQSCYRNTQVFDDDDLWRGNIYNRMNDKGITSVTRRNYSQDPYSTLNRRDRCRLLECWYREPIAAKIIRGNGENPHNGEIFDPENEEHVRMMDEQMISVHDGIYMQMRCAVMTEEHLLQDIASPYRHNKFPFVPTWAYRRGRDNHPYGVIRNAKDPQEDMNKRASKALFILSTNKIIAEKNAVDDWNETIEEAARPDGVIKVNGDRRFDMVVDRNLADSHLNLMDRDLNYIHNASGVTEENLGRQTESLSGRAILAKQNEGAVTTFEIFDNLRFCFQNVGERALSLIEQWYTDEKSVRIVGEQGRFKFDTVNRLEWDELEGEWVRRNDITALRSDFIVDTYDFRQTVRQAMFEQMMEMTKSLPPEISLNLLDLVVELSDLPGREAIVERLRAINGQIDPHENPTPEQIQQQRQRAMEQQRQQEIAERDQMANIQEREARTEKIRMESQDQAIEAAQKIMGSLPAAGAADELLKSAGFDDKNAAQRAPVNPVTGQPQR